MQKEVMGHHHSLEPVNLLRAEALTELVNSSWQSKSGSDRLHLACKGHRRHDVEDLLLLVVVERVEEQFAKTTRFNYQKHGVGQIKNLAFSH